MLSGGTMDIKNKSHRNNAKQPVHARRGKEAVEVTDSCF